MLQVRFAPRALRGTDKAAFRTQRGQTVITTGQVKGRYQPTRLLRDARY